jgi:hypothetical protein
MDQKVRRRLEAGARVLEFSRAHPDESPGYTESVDELERLLARARELAIQQQEGAVQVHAASVRKNQLRRTIRRHQLVHLARVARRASREIPGMAEQFRLAPQQSPYLVFKTTSSRLLNGAHEQKELLLRYGLHAKVLETLEHSLDQFDQAAERAVQGRRMQVGASAELNAVADEIGQLIKLLDGFNHFRFATDSEALAAWVSASNVVGPSRADKNLNPETPSPDGGLRPAA